MAMIFISHDSKDKIFARKLAADLAHKGHSPWLDEGEIKIGENIISSLSDGLGKTDFMVLILSENSVKSEWVEREWKTKYWDEIQHGRTILLPVLIKTCEIPILLSTKKYADFRGDYELAFSQLLKSINTITEDQNVDIDDIELENVHDISGLNNKNSDQNRKTEFIANSNNIIRSCLNATFSNIDLIRSFCLDSFPDVHREIKNEDSHVAIVDKIIQHCRSNLCEEHLWAAIKMINVNQHKKYFAAWRKISDIT